MSSPVIEFIVRVHEEDGGLWAEVIDLPGCFASADNLDGLKEALEESIALYLGDDPTYAQIVEGTEPMSPEPRHLEVGEMRVKVPALART